MSENQFKEEVFTSQINIDTVIRIAKQGLTHWHLMLGILISVAFIAVLEAFHTYLSKQMIDLGIIPRDITALKYYAGIYAATLLVFAVFVFSLIYCAGILGHKVEYTLRKRLFDHLQNLSLSYFDKTPSGWIISRLTSDLNWVGGVISWGFLDLTSTFLSIGVSLIFMFFIDVKMTLIIIILVPVLIKVAFEFKKRILREYRTVRKVNSKITRAYSENIRGVRVVKSLRREEVNLGKFQKLTGDMFSSSYRAAWLSAFFLPSVQIVTSVGVALVVLYSGIRVQTGGLTIGSIHAFVSYITFMLWPIQQLATFYANSQQAVASAERVFSLLDTKVKIKDSPDAFDPGTIHGDITFDRVDFQYDEGKPVLSNFNLRIPRGETVALVGPTGAGKSTIVNLLCRFYEPTGGSIRFNGNDYRKLSQHAIHSRIGMVLQTPHLFSGSVLENLQYGNLEAEHDDIMNASKMAGAHNFISKLEEGYETQVGEGGVLLSTGQKQLISLARAILSDPDLFIMDEATSSVDTLTEALIQKGMEALMTGRTSFIIAHRLSTIKNADRILVIEDGKILEMGSHSELIRSKGHYYQLYTKQFRDEKKKAYGLDGKMSPPVPVPA